MAADGEGSVSQVAKWRHGRYRTTAAGCGCYRGRMAARKSSVTLGVAHEASVRALATDANTISLSAFLDHDVEMALNDAAEWEETLATALEQTGGPLTPEERAWADSILSPAPRKPRRPHRRKRA